jgi:hypothetical protein
MLWASAILNIILAVNNVALRARADRAQALIDAAIEGELNDTG